MTIQTGTFCITADTNISFQPECKEIARYFIKFLEPATGFSLKGQEFLKAGNSSGNTIHLELLPGTENSVSEEGYYLSVTPQSIRIQGKDLAGCFYGIQTIRQLLPGEIESPVMKNNVHWTIPCVNIKDNPRFPWRGFMIDDARHFLGKVNVKRMIDIMTLFKLNKLHWHLTDDEGWRIESKKFPKLHEIASKRLRSAKFRESPNLDDPAWYGGFYTQEEIKEILAYAHSRFIEVIPEIEMPGHATAALVAYPEVSCAAPPTTVPIVGQRNRHSFCAGNPKTYEFLQGVLTEIMELFGGNKIHIGADELPTERWKACPRCQNTVKDLNLGSLDELQVHFAAQIIKFLGKRDFTTSGWFDFPVDRLLDQNIDTSKLIFQFWVGSAQKVIDFIRKGGNAVISDHRSCYLDYGYYRINLKKAYLFDPIPADLEARHHKQVYGMEAPIWGEYVINSWRQDFQVFPRLIAYAETGWTPREKKNYPDFFDRVKRMLPRLDTMCVAYAPLDATTHSWRQRLKPKSMLAGRNLFPS